MQLARGIPLAGLLVLSACSSDVPRETPRISLTDGGATSGAAKSSPVVAVAKSPAAQESRQPTATVHAEEKNGVAERSINFSDGDTALSEESVKVLRQQAEYLKQNPKRCIVLRAYLDSLGSRTFSLAIVQKRLNVVAETLREQGVAKSRIRPVMLGQRGKKQGCESPSCQIRGQRIELLYK
jgi:outer membrane protein OmpA-like peptidoglycan-associated protein